MTAVQFAFLAGLTVVSAAIVAFTALVLFSARRIDGGPRLATVLRNRLGRSPYDLAEGNRWAFYIHRVTGFAVFAFLALHLLDVGLYALSPDLFDEVHALYSTPLMRVFECGLLFALLFHALNGLRLLVIDLADVGARAAGRLLDGVGVVTLAGTAAGSAVILWPVFVP